MRTVALTTFLVLVLAASVNAATPESHTTNSVCEPMTELPVAFNVDVVVSGGSLAGVEAACAAAEEGAKVLLVESRPYLGYDLCGTQRLWLDKDETPGTTITKKLFNGSKVVTPFQVKRTLSQALLDGGIQFLTGTFADDLLVGNDGSPGGITIVNRSGRQAVKARVIIDATKDATLTRRSGAKFKPFKPGPKELRLVVVGGELVKGVRGRGLADTVYRSRSGRSTKKKDYPVFEYTLTADMKSDSFGALCAALNEARTKVFNNAVVDISEHPIYVPDNTIVPVAAGGHGIGAFQPAGVKALYVLSAYAGLDRVEMKQALKPAAFAAIGRQIGIDAAKTANGLSAPGGLRYAGPLPSPRPSKAARKLAVTETPASFRFRDCPKLKLGDCNLPVLGEFDVVVVGGGTAGAPAGIGAARSGAKTLVIEFLDELGGVGTAGLIGRYWYGHRIGFTAEMGKVSGLSSSVVRKSEWYRSELLKSGAEIWFGCLGCGALMDGNKVSGAVVATPFGRGVVRAGVVIDATGNADVAAAAGAPTQFSISALGDLNVQMAGYPHRNLGDSYNNTCYAMVDDRDVFDRWHLLVSQTLMQGEKAPYDMGQLIDTRDRRRIVGDHVLSTVDILMHRKFPDTISHHKSNFDAAAHPDSKMLLIKDMKGPVYSCDMPLRSLTAKGLEGLLVVGLGASSERDAMTLLRMQPDVQNQGYAAGLAAALAVANTGGLIRKIDIKQLQKALVEKGCLEKRVLADGDSFPIGPDKIKAAVQTLHDLTIEERQRKKLKPTFPALAAVMSNPGASIPLLKEAYGKAGDDVDRVNFARILAVLGDATGRDTLIKAVEESKGWGQGDELTPARASANVFGEIDRLVIALGFLRDPGTRPLLVRKLEALHAGSALSHYKAICVALRLNKHTSLVQPLARLLQKKGVKGHVQQLGYYAASNGVVKLPNRATTGKEGGNALNRKFKELLVAALLFECGDSNDEGRKILEAYTRDINGHFASYANFILNK